MVVCVCVCVGHLTRRRGLFIAATTFFYLTEMSEMFFNVSSTENWKLETQLKTGLLREQGMA